MSGVLMGLPVGVVLKLVMMGHCPAFHALVDGHDALLELDTGSFELRLSPEFAAKNQFGSSVSLKIGDLPDARCKPIVEGISQPSAPNIGDRFSPRPDGIVGLDILRGYAVGVDTLGETITFWPGGKLGTEFSNKWTLTQEGGSVARDPNQVKRLDLTTRSSVDWFRVQAKINGQAVNLVLDTGTAISSVNPSLPSRLGLKKIADTEVEEIGKTEVLPVMVADSLTFGGAEAEFPVLNVESEEDPDSDGILGTESLGEGKYLIDMPDLKLYVRQIRNGKHANVFESRLRLAGLDIFPDSKNRLLVLVRPGGVADKAGVRSGDQLLSIGSVSVDDLGVEKAGEPAPLSKMFKLGMAMLQKNISLTVQRTDGTKVRVELPVAG
jgi:hypothetical protein